jgi:UDP-N-acetyl-D-mannosaminuronic acid transferase (WecB/TagA/CpsF family)
MIKFRKILGINYFVGSLAGLLEESKKGGLIVVPAAPALAELETNHEYRRALEKATFAITDSSFLVLLWFLRKGEILTRISGLQYVRGLVSDEAFRRPGATYWVMPSNEDMLANLTWLKGQGISVASEYCHIAPHYAKGQVFDEKLLSSIEARRPAYVVINIGGGTQEVLGAYLASRLSYSPAIVCTGAAIAFLSGRQAKIHPWLDRLMLAWLVRCLHEPRKFVPRYLRGFGLIQVVLTFADRPVSVAQLRN